MHKSMIVLLTVTAALAGCADDGAEPETPEQAFASGQGIIEGLLVDDRFRPIGAAPGLFILVSESGDELTPNENGEFVSPALDPGSYTLRATVPGHELTPVTVQVRAAEASEVTLVARRLSNLDDVAISTEYSFFIPCTIGLGLTVSNYDCTNDQSADSNRYAKAIPLDPDNQPDFALTEIVLNKNPSEIQHGTWKIQIIGDGPEDTGFAYNYAAKSMKEGPYDSIFLVRGENSAEQEAGLFLEFGPWERTEEFVVRLWGQGQLREPIQTATGGALNEGVGLQIGTRAQGITTMFYGGDRATAEAGCKLC